MTRSPRTPPSRGAAAALAVAIARGLTRPAQRVHVAGRSMLPALAPGDRLVVVRRRRIRPGHIVAVGDPRTGRVLVKRVAALDGGGVTVVGDNLAESTDSRTFGPVSRPAVLGVAVYRYAPAARAGRL